MERMDMRRVDNSNKRKATNAFAEITLQIRIILKNLNRIDDMINLIEEQGVPMSAQQKADIRAKYLTQAKNSMKTGFKIWRWLYEELGITPQSPFTDAQIDQVNENIRTHRSR